MHGTSGPMVQRINFFNQTLRHFTNSLQGLTPLNTISFGCAAGMNREAKAKGIG
jgi:hypothetical protein